MLDATLPWSSDLSPSPTGDVALTAGDTLGQQRLLRRLLTNPGDYLWQPEFGAGLGSFIVSTCDVSAIKARIRSQIFLESTVSRVPEPVIYVQDAMDGGVYVQLQYVDASTGTSQTLSFTVSQ